MSRNVDLRWCSPSHLTFPHNVAQEGVRSQELFGGHIKTKLTDKAIHKYALQGYYGFEKMVAAQEYDKRKKKK